MSNSPVTQASLTTRAQVWFTAQPLVSKSVLVLCASLSAVALFTGWDLAAAACLETSLVLRRLQLYRLFTSAVVHGGIMHVAFNMLAFVPAAAALERQLGSLQLLHLLLLFALVGDACFLAGSALADWLLATAIPSCAVGLSGVVFALIVVETAASGASHRSIFGFFSVPAPWFPWALLALWQLLLPHVSFFGHLGGILAGTLHARGWLRPLIPAAATFQAAERLGFLQPVVRQPSFVSCTGGSLLPTSVSASDSGGGAGSSSGGGGPAQAWQPPQGWGAGGLPGWLRLPTSDPDPPPGQGPASAAPPGRPGAAAKEQGKPAGRAYVLGGSSASPPPGGVAPHLAAAAAAEARAQRGGAAQQPPDTGKGAGARSGGGQ